MRDVFRLKTWAGPLTIGSFVVVGGTGILMFFHLNVGLVKLAHEWLGWLLVVGALAHLVVNWKPFLGYFRRPVGVAIMGILLVLGGLSLFSGAAGPPGGHGGRGRPPFMAATAALEQSSLSVVAQVAGNSVDSLVEQLQAQGIRVQDGRQTIREIGEENGVRSMEILGYIFGRAEASPGGRSRG